MILPKVRDPRFITIRRGGSLTNSDHRLLALWAAACAEHVLHLFESAQPSDLRPRNAIEQARAWVRGEVKMMESRAAGGAANSAARPLSGAPRFAAYAAGQAAVVAHVAAHELGAAAYAIKAVRAADPKSESESAARLECQWQRKQLPEAIRALVLDDQRLRSGICCMPLTTEALVPDSKTSARLRFHSLPQLFPPFSPRAPDQTNREQMPTTVGRCQRTNRSPRYSPNACAQTALGWSLE